MEPLSGVPYVHVGEHFIVDHAVPVARPGWFVIVSRRHAAALHELTTDEWRELGELLPRLVAAVHDAANSEKEYVMQLAEAPGFQHIHWHVVGIVAGDTARGTDVFQLLKPERPVPPAELAPFCDRVRAALSA
jgi:diadenosine tetraphosphate (Ap4A) HIT family hydrolase